MSGYWQAINYVRVKWLNLPEVGYEKTPLVSHVKLVKDGLIKLPFCYVPRRPIPFPGCHLVSTWGR